MFTFERTGSRSWTRALVLSIAALIAIALVSPVSAGAVAPSASGKGTLQVVIAGLDAGTRAKVTVTGPSGYSRTVTATATMGRLASGVYEIKAKPVRTSAGVAVASVQPAKVTVRNGKTATAKVTYIVNLLTNPGFENGAAVAGIPNYKAFATDGWTPAAYDASGKLLSADRFPYGTTYAGGINGGLTPTTPGPAARGARYASGGILNHHSTLTQTVALDNLAATIDAGKASFLLSAWLGGYADQNDAFGVTVTFLNAAGQPLGNAAIGPVTKADRGNDTKLMQRSTTGAVPPQARSATVQIATVPAEGGTFNDAYADNVVLAVF